MKTPRMAFAALLAIGMLTTTGFADTGAAQTISGTATIPADRTASYLLDGKTISATAPEGLVPLRLFSENLGYTVTWESDSHRIVLKKGENPEKALLTQDLSNGLLKDGRWYVPLYFFDSVLGNTVIVKDTGETVIESSRYAPDEASTLGVVADVLQGKDGIQILVKGQKFGQNGYDEISLALPHTVTVINGTLQDVKKDSLIYVKYGTNVTKSMPPMGQGISVEILKEENLLMGKIMDITEGVPAEISRIRVIGTSDFVLGITKDTVITDAAGKITTKAALKEGMIVKVYTSPIAALSMPPQTGAYRIYIQ